MKKIILPGGADAGALPASLRACGDRTNAKTIEDTTTYEGDTIKITIDQWCYAFNRTNLRFFCGERLRQRPGADADRVCRGAVFQE